MFKKRRIKILFFCFGFSIHAKRRIEIFTNDKKFEVAVISNFNYNFKNAENYKLNEDSGYPQDLLGGNENNILENIIKHKLDIIKHKLDIIKPKMEKIKKQIKLIGGIENKNIFIIFKKIIYITIYKFYKNNKKYKIKFIIKLQDKMNKLKIKTNKLKINIQEKKNKKYDLKKRSFFLLNIEKKLPIKYSDIRENPITFQIFNSYNKIYDIYKKFKPDIIFLQTLLFPCYLSLFIKIKIPILITFWNGDITWWAKWDGFDRLLKKEIVEYGIKISKLITVNSRFAYKKCLDYYNIKKEKIHIIHYPGVDLKRFKPLNKDLAKKVIKINYDKIVLWPRGLGGYLNSDILIKAAYKVLKLIKIYFIVILNDKDELDKHIRLANSYNIEKYFIWKDKVDFNDMPYYYRASDVVVSLSSNDSLPNMMIEAMACGVPLIMSDIPQIREWITDFDNGYLVPERDPDILADRLEKVINNYNNNNELFVKKNLKIVKNNFDSKKNSEVIKNLVLKKI